MPVFCGSSYSTIEASNQPSNLCSLTVAKTRSHSTPLTLRFSGETSTIVSLSSVNIYFPLGVWRRFAPPLSPALILPRVGCGVEVNVAVALGVSVNVFVGVALGVFAVNVAGLAVTADVGVALDFSFVAVALSDVTDGAIVGVLEGRGVSVKVGDSVGGEVGVEKGIVVDVIITFVGIVVSTVSAEDLPNATCGNIKKINIAISKTIAIPLAMPPAFVGLSFRTKSVINPSRLASEKCTTKTSKP